MDSVVYKTANSQGQQGPAHELKKKEQMKGGAHLCEECVLMNEQL